MRRLEEVLRQMCSAAKAIGNTELENKFAEGRTRVCVCECVCVCSPFSGFSRCSSEEVLYGETEALGLLRPQYSSILNG